MSIDKPVPTSSRELGSRIKLAVSRIGTQREAADTLNVALSSLRRWVDGDNEPGFGSMVALAEKAGVRLEWLATGAEPMIAVPDIEPMVPSSIAASTDVELMAALTDGMMKLYKELAVTIVPAEFGRRLGQEHDDIVAAEPDPALRRDMVKLVLAKLRRELLTPTANDSRKQQA